VRSCFIFNASFVPGIDARSCCAGLASRRSHRFKALPRHRRLQSLCVTSSAGGGAKGAGDRGCGGGGEGGGGDTCGDAGDRSAATECGTSTDETEETEAANAMTLAAERRRKAVVGPCLLHFVNCGFDEWRRK